MKFEIWKDIKDYEGIYQVSNYGEVKRLPYTKENNLTKTTSYYKERVLCENSSGNNYKYVMLCKNDKTIKYYVHRLVAEAFIPNPENKPQVNHKDGNKLNNIADNLEWCTRSENMKHAFKNHLINMNTQKKKQSELRNIKIARKVRLLNAKNRNTL